MIGRVALAGVMMLASLGAAHALTATTTTIASSQNPSVAGQPVTFTATVSGAGGTPTGIVTFLDSGSPIGSGTLDNAGHATVTTTTLAVGNHTITTSYPGDGTFGGSTGSLTGSPQVVNKNGTTTQILSSVNPSTSTQSVTFTAILSPVTPTGGGLEPGGTVTFLDGGSPIGSGTLGVNGQATFSTSALAIGNHTITTSYGGDANFTGSTGSLTGNPQVVNKATTTMTLVSSPNPSNSGQAVTFTATVSPGAVVTATPSGTVTFLDGGSPIGTGALNPSGTSGQATFTTSALAVGNHTITVSYPGDGNFSGSTGSLAGNPQVVNKVTPSVSGLTSAPNPSVFGQSVTFTATFKGSGGVMPTGTVTFVDAGSPIGTGVLNSSGQATFTTSALAVGNHTITANYPGDSNFGPSTASSSQAVNKAQTTTTVTSSANPSTFGQAVTFTATVSSSAGTPTGTVNFSVDGGTTIPETLSGGVATFSTASLGVGIHTITATYLGDTNFNGSGPTSLTQNVNPRTPTTTTLVSSQNPSTVNQSVTFTATVVHVLGGTPTGSITFTDQSTGQVLGTVPLTIEHASLTTSALAAGTHNIVATYSGDANFLPSSASLTQIVTGGSSDSTKLRELQISATPIIAQGWAQAATAAMDDAVGTGFGGNPQSLSPAGTGFTYYFNDDPPQRATDADQDSLRRYLASPNGSTNSAAANDSVKRVDDDFRALGYAPTATKAPPASPAVDAPRDWLAWINVRGTDFFRGTFGNDLKGDQVDAFAGLTRRITPNFVVGVMGGYEHFDYSSQAFNGVLKGDGWTAGAYLGWKLGANLRFDAGGAWSDLLANGVSGSASGHFLGTRWLINGGLTGTYPWQSLVFEPSARVFALWEHENAYTDSLGTFQAARNFETGRASAGVKAIYPLAWTSSAVALSPYAGLYADYYFSKDDALTAGLTTVPLLQGFSARATGGVAASFAGGATLGAGGEFGGIGSANHIWTWTARGRIPF